MTSLIEISESLVVGYQTLEKC